MYQVTLRGGPSVGRRSTRETWADLRDSRQGPTLEKWRAHVRVRLRTLTILNGRSEATTFHIGNTGRLVMASAPLALRLKSCSPDRVWRDDLPTPLSQHRHLDSQNDRELFPGACAFNSRTQWARSKLQAAPVIPLKTFNGAVPC
jgi:hypothetical protein